MEKLFAGRYRVMKRLGGGAQGLAIQVSDTLRDGATAVLKLGRSGVEARDGTIAEFEALRTLTTPYTAPVLTLGFCRGQDLALFDGLDMDSALAGDRRIRPFLVRTWVDGPTIVEWAQRQLYDLPLEDAMLALREVLAHLTEAIAELHRAGLTHGDLKPEHVLVVEGQRPVLIDFGLAARGDRGTRGGTPGYLAPERLRGIPATTTSDRFALGVIVAQTLAGERIPVRPASRREDLPEHVLARPWPERVLQATRRLLDADPNQRPSLDAVRTALLPPSAEVEGWSSLQPRQLPFLGVARRQKIDTLLGGALGNASHAIAPVVLLVGERGSGRSRMMRQIGWELQRAGRSALELFGGAQPWQRLLQLGPQLASLSGRTFEARSPSASGGDRARWLRALADSLIEVLPTDPVALLWDDIGEDPLEGLDAVEAAILAMEQSDSRLRLWASTTPEGLAKLRPLFASVGFGVVQLDALARADLDGLLGTEHLGRRLREGELDRLYRRSRGLPARLSRLLIEGESEVLAHSSTSGQTDTEALVMTLAGLVPGGATADEIERAAHRAGHPLEIVRQAIERSTARRTLQLAPPRTDRPGERAYTAPFTPPGRLPERLQRELGRALQPLGAQHPHIEVLSAALRRDEVAVLDAWRRHRARLKAEQARALVLVILEAALRAVRDGDVLTDFLDAALESGHLALGQEALDRISDATQDLEWLGRLGVGRIRLAFAAGQPIDELVRALPLELPPVEAGYVADLQAQLDLRRSRYPEAHARAFTALAHLSGDTSTQAEVLRAHLWVTAAAAEVMQGSDTNHAELEAMHGKLAAVGATAKARARYHAMRAVANYMQGHLDRATESYRTALEIVEQEGLDADRPLYLLNLGTAYERQGRLSMARQYYNLGGRCCLPTTRATTRALLLANRANIDIKLGRAHEARELLAAAGRIAQETGLDFVTRFVQQLGADADASEGRLDDAEPIYIECAERFRDLGDKRHACELFIKAGLAAARAGRVQDARRHLSAAEVDVEEFADHKLRASVLRAEIAMARGGIERIAGVDRYLRALEKAVEAGDDLTVLTEARWLLRRLREDTESTDPLAYRELVAIAGRAWRRVALSLTPELRRDMARHLGLDQLLDIPTEAEHPRHNAPSPSHTSAVTMEAPLRPLLGQSAPLSRPTMRTLAPIAEADRRETELADKFYRLLSLGRRIIGETDLDRLIPAALDIALSLTGAERGFLLLRGPDDGPFEVAFSRDVDGRPIDPEKLRISETIARRAAEEGRIIITDDASQDDRFGQAKSVHAFSLTAILCVPIRDRDRPMGCLYLDKSGVPGAFDGHISRMMAAYGDQVAIALLSAERVAQLRDERDELRRAQARIKTLLADKEEMLLDLETRCHRLEADLARERHDQALRWNEGPLIAHAPAMQRVLAQVDRVADTLLPIVVQGESGTGKEVMARAIHWSGRRRDQPFVAINCGALAESLLESELFGHKKGAFTGANRDRAGLFEAASGGTLFLDEVGEMSLAMQVKLLRALQEKRVRPVGANAEMAVDVRIIAATNRNLRRMVQDGTFREDLFYRLATLIVDLPPLRERREDIPLLVRHLLTRACKEAGRDIPDVDGRAVSLLMGHRWPGNIRQLENIVRAASVMSDATIGADLIAELLPHDPGQKLTAVTLAALPALPPGRPPKCTPTQVAESIRLSDGNRTAAAARLNVSLRTLQRYIKKYDL